MGCASQGWKTHRISAIAQRAEAAASAIMQHTEVAANAITLRAEAAMPYQVVLCFNSIYRGTSR